MVELRRHGSEVGSVFDLLGYKENDLTAALGFALARCPQLCTAVAARIADADNLTGDTAIALEVRDDDGRTDLELRIGESLFIFEAKRGWLLPGTNQLARYARRIQRNGGRGGLVTLSQASHALAVGQLPSEVDGISVFHLPWGEVLEDIAAVKHRSRGRERVWLDELRTYLKGVIRVRSVADCWVYSVALNDVKPAGGETSFKDFVREQRCYFHPYGEGGWPTVAPNFMAFRGNGAVRRIHRVVGSEVVTHLAERWPYMADNPDADRPHTIYELGEQIPPLEPIRNGANYRAIRLWVLLDQLQVAETLADAVARSKRLREQA
ncbi:hypothetical protein [Mycobacteroides abscessus]|uniref:hypothetical protein n=1 Tax=Mycobacteroides abscessus TaxID=36809 RepID=UPI000C25F5E7|nr:hypothetical protein [Mycobacteroides abscessus]